MSIISKKNILITGGAGFIGSKLAQELSSFGCRVKIVDKNRTGSPDLKKFIENSKNLARFDFIFHLAGSSSIKPSIENPKFDLEQNVDYTLLLLESLKQLKKPPLLIYASSAAVYGIPQKTPIRENDPVLPISPYGISKMTAERYIAFYAREYGIKSLILRFFSVYGPGQKKQLIFELAKKIRTGQKIEIDPNQSRDYIYIDDLVRAIILVTKNVRGRAEIYNIANGKPTTSKEVAEAIGQVWQTKPEVKLKKSVIPLYVEKVDISKIKKLGFQPKVKFEDGLRNIKKWFDEEKDV